MSDISKWILLDIRDPLKQSRADRDLSRANETLPRIHDMVVA